jgi:hypothetical protein
MGHRRVKVLQSQCYTQLSTDTCGSDTGWITTVVNYYYVNRTILDESVFFSRVGELYASA